MLCVPTRQRKIFPAPALQMVSEHPILHCNTCN